MCYWDKWSVGDNLWSRRVQKFSPIPISLTGQDIPYKLVDKIVDKGELIAMMPEGHSASIKEGYRLWKFYLGVIKLHLHYKIPIIPTAAIGFVKAAPIVLNYYNPKRILPWEKELMLPFIFPRKILFHFGKAIIYESYFDQEHNKQVLFKLAEDLRKEIQKIIALYKESVSWSRLYGLKKKALN